MKIVIEKINIELNQEQNAVRILTSNNDKFLLANQSIDHIKNLIIENFYFVRNHYLNIVGTQIILDDINNICLKLVLRYVHMYNIWNITGEAKKKSDLKFLNEDFSHPITFDLVISYFKEKYPEDYRRKCSTFLKMSIAEFLQYEKKGLNFIKCGKHFQLIKYF